MRPRSPAPAARWLSLAFLLAAAACGGDDGDGGNDGGDTLDGDARCVAICQIDEPEIEGAGEVCSMSSAELCVADCEARIADASSSCAGCLLQDACFGCDGRIGDGDSCGPGGCTTSGPEGECTYPEGDEAAYEDCRRQVDPLREISCDAEYRDPVECGELCA